MRSSPPRPLFSFGFHVVASRTDEVDTELIADGADLEAASTDKSAIHDSTGIHVKPARQIVKIAKQFADTAITVTRGEKSVKADALLRLIALGVHGGDQIIVTCDGPNEMAATVAMQNYFWNHL